MKIKFSSLPSSLGLILAGFWLRLVLLHSALLPVTVSGDPAGSIVFELIQVQKLIRSGANAEGAWFSWAMDADGNTAAVSLLLDNTNGEEAGAVVVLEYDPLTSRWSQQGTVLLDNMGGESDYLGEDVAVSGETVVAGSSGKDVGAVDNDDDQGAVLVWDRTGGSTWSLSQTIFAPDAETGANFGEAVDIDGDRLAVGAKNDGENSEGAVYVYQRTTGMFGTPLKVVPDTPVATERFGTSVALEGDLLVVGTDTDRVIAFVFNGTAWNQDQELLNLGNSGIGPALDIDDGKIVVGIRADNDVYIYNQDYTTTPTLLSGTGRFGSSVSKKDGLLAVGAPDASSEEGRVRLYNDTDGMGNWTFIQEINSRDNDDGDKFGISVALPNVGVLVGAYFDEESGINAGAVYAFLENPRTDAPSAVPSLSPSLSPSTETPSAQPSRELCAEDECDLNRFLDIVFSRRWMNAGEDGKCRERCVWRRRVNRRKRQGWTCGRCV